MRVRDFKPLSALFDGERVCAQTVLDSLRLPGAMDFLVDIAILRLWVQQDDSRPSDNCCRLMREKLAQPDKVPHHAAVGSSVEAGRAAWDGTSDLLGGTSPRQAQILRCFIDGCSEKEVSDRLRIKQSTVHTHVKLLHRKFGVHDRTQLLAAALRTSSDR
jgi:DNA-binding CsgD family transcriptional regulator